MMLLILVTSAGSCHGPGLRTQSTKQLGIVRILLDRCTYAPARPSALDSSKSRLVESQDKDPDAAELCPLLPTEAGDGLI